MTENTMIEETEAFKPRYNADGLIPCVTVCAKTNAILMMAYMNEEALTKTIETGEVHYWSRSREELWHKGATSGNTQGVKDIQIDCDQDCLLITVEANGDIACHTGRKSCFYRRVKNTSQGLQLEFID